MNTKYSILPLLLLVTLLSGCELIGDIFAAGAYTGIILMVILIALVIWVISKFRG